MDQSATKYSRDVALLKTITDYLYKQQLIIDMFASQKYGFDQWEYADWQRVQRRITELIIVCEGVKETFKGKDDE